MAITAANDTWFSPESLHTLCSTIHVFLKSLPIPVFSYMHDLKVEAVTSKQTIALPA